jgi:hypothetical protein
LLLEQGQEVGLAGDQRHAIADIGSIKGEAP